jgi:hypothetical protein
MVSQTHLDAFDRADRDTHDGAMRCKKGKPCNGRCIPKGHKCAVESAGAVVSGSALMTAAKWGALVGSSVIRYKVGQVVVGGLKKGKAVRGANEARQAASAAAAAGNPEEAAKQRAIAKEILNKGRTNKNVGRHTKAQQTIRGIKSKIPTKAE